MTDTVEAVVQFRSVRSLEIPEARNFSPKQFLHDRSRDIIIGAILEGLIPSERIDLPVQTVEVLCLEEGAFWPKVTRSLGHKWQKRMASGSVLLFLANEIDPAIVRSNIFFRTELGVLFAAKMDLTWFIDALDLENAACEGLFEQAGTLFALSS